MKNNPRILLSIFKRRGAEGLKTKIIEKSNKIAYSGLLSKLEAEEKPLIICYWNNSNWILLTSIKLLVNDEGVKSSIFYDNIIRVIPALEEEFEHGVTDKTQFTRLKIEDKNHKAYILKLETGSPFQGIYQVLHFIISRNK
jgi:hypothetical protein